MVNFKQIVEDCLAGKLSGIFVLRNKQVFHSKTHLSSTMFRVYPYCIAGGYYSVAGNCYGGGISVRDNDVINFIPDNMQEQIKIDIPEGKVPVMESSENGVIITWKEHELTYTELLNKFRNNINCIHSNLINSSSQAFYKKVEVLRKLINIRNYFGKPNGNENGFYINLLGQAATNGFPSKYASDIVVFAKREHAEQAIKMLGDELKYLFEPW